MLSVKELGAPSLDSFRKKKADDWNRGQRSRDGCNPVNSLEFETTASRMQARSFVPDSGWFQRSKATIGECPTPGTVRPSCMLFAKAPPINPKTPTPGESSQTLRDGVKDRIRHFHPSLSPKSPGD